MSWCVGHISDNCVLGGVADMTWCVGHISDNCVLGGVNLKVDAYSAHKYQLHFMLLNITLCVGVAYYIAYIIIK